MAALRVSTCARTNKGEHSTQGRHPKETQRKGIPGPGACSRPSRSLNSPPHAPARFVFFASAVYLSGARRATGDERHDAVLCPAAALPARRASSHHQTPGAGWPKRRSHIKHRAMLALDPPSMCIWMKTTRHSQRTGKRETNKQQKKKK